MNSHQQLCQGNYGDDCYNASVDIDPRPRETIPYANPAKSSHRFLNIIAVAGAFLVLGLFYIGLAPGVQGFAFNYTKRIPLHRAIARALSISIYDVLNDRHAGRMLWFLPVAAGFCAAFVLLRGRRSKLAAALLASVLPALFLRPFAMIRYLPELTLHLLPASILGQCDGEEWSEGQISWAAMGGWTSFWWLISLAMLVSIVLWRRIPIARSTTP